MTSRTGRIASLNASNGGVPKLPVLFAHVSANGMDGDRQRDRRFHGGSDRALCLYSLELIDALAGEGHPIYPGAAGENVTIAGLDWSLVIPGARLRLGDVEAEVTGYTTPCRNIRDVFLGEEFTRISQKLRPGWSRVYVRILHEGTLRVDDPVEVLSP